MRFWRHGILFYLGGLLYVGLELLWRGWSHGCMFAVGGICFLLIGHLQELHSPLPLWAQTLVGAGIIVVAELAAGLLFNTDYRIWDYRSLPGNFMGQICLPYGLLWLPVSLGAILIYAIISNRISALPAKHRNHAD